MKTQIIEHGNLLVQIDYPLSYSKGDIIIVYNEEYQVTNIYIDGTGIQVYIVKTGRSDAEYNSVIKRLINERDTYLQKIDESSFWERLKYLLFKNL